ncbi:uncharacterized protein LOC135849722 [Planococcus citri]|uniref:uncharacterized protein LOC135849722 n=1 Tax=Planococcus citri TaxID=170843 RepID=UPI0031F790E7
MEDKLWDILPKFYEYKIDTFEGDESNNFDATFKVNLFNEISVKNWLKQFEQCSLTNFRVARTAPAKRTRVLFKKYYRCHHNTRASESASKTKKAHVKHTGCEATLLITVNNSCMKSCKQLDVKRFPCTVKYHNYHNHPLSSEELLCHRKPIERIENKIRELLLKNHTPVSALKILKQDLQQEFKDEYSKIVKDGAFCPKLQWIYHKYYSIFKEMYTDPYKIKCFPAEFIEEYEESDSENDESSRKKRSVSAASRSLNTNSSTVSVKNEDVMYDEFILSPEDELLLENHLVEVYTIDQNDSADYESEDVFIPEENIADMPLIRDDMSPDDRNELFIVDDEICRQRNDDLMIDETVVTVNDVHNVVTNHHESKLWSSADGHLKIELHDDFSDILKEDIFLPSVKDELEDAEKLVDT